MADYSQTEKQNQGSQSGNPQEKKPTQQTPGQQHPQPAKKDVQTDDQQQREKTGTNR